MFSLKEKQKIISKYLQTKDGQQKLAISMTKPLVERLIFHSIPAILFKTESWTAENSWWTPDNYFLTGNRLGRINNCNLPKILKYKIRASVNLNKDYYFSAERLMDELVRQLYQNENDLFYKLVQKVMNLRLIKTVVKEKITLRTLESLSKKYDFLVCTAQTYSKFRKVLAAKYKDEKGVLHTQGIRDFNKMRIIVTKSTLKDHLLFYKKEFGELERIGELARTVENIVLQIFKNKKGIVLKVTCDQKFQMAINPKNMFGIKLI
jgi:hypothetical protein